MEDEYYGAKSGRKKKGTTIRAFLPVLGFLMIAAMGGVAYALSGPINLLLQDQLGNNYPVGQETVMQIVSGVVLFILFVLVAGLLYALFAPRTNKLATEQQMEKERREMWREKERKKRRQRQIQKKMAEDVRRKRQNR